MNSSLWGRIWADLSDVIGPVGLLLGALGFGIAYLLYRQNLLLHRALQEQHHWTQDYLVRVIERNTYSAALVARQVEEVARGGPSSGSCGSS